MGRSILFAGVFAVAGLVVFALLAPLVFQGDMAQTGALALPVIVLIFGALGFVVGSKTGRRN